MNIKLIVIEIKKLQAEVLSEKLKREEIKESVEYKALEAQAKKILEEQTKMFEGLPDSEYELEEKKKELYNFMLDTGVKEADGAKIKYSVKKEVNLARLKEIVPQDDIWAYVKFTQKDLTDYAKQFKSQNPEYSAAVLKCIEVVSETPSGIEIE